jgi:hypothetical protein
LALGLNEFAGYVSVALVGFFTGYIAAVYGLKPYPFYLGITFPIVGFLISILLVKDTKEFTQLEIKNYPKDKKRNQENKKRIELLDDDDNEEEKHAIVSNSYLPNKSNKLNFKEVFIETSWKNRSLLAVSQAGLVNNLVFGVSWGLFTLYFVSLGVSVNDTAFLKALHPGVWGFLQLATGPFSGYSRPKKDDLSRNDYASNRNLANFVISRYLFWSTYRNVYFGHRNSLCISCFTCCY